MTPAQAERDERILLLSSNDRAPAIPVGAAELAAAGLKIHPCADAAALAAELAAGAGAVLLAEEALGQEDFERLRAVLDRQPAWSDVPVIALCAAERQAAALRRWSAARRLPLLLPPGAPAELIREALRTALAARRRQSEAAAAQREGEGRKDQFLSHVAHELRNPLAAISNGVCVLRQPGAPAPERVARVAEILDRQTRHLVRLVEELLDFSRVTTGRLALERRPLELGEVVERAAAAGPSPLQRAGGALWLEGDAARLEQALGQLLSEAAQGAAAPPRLHLAEEGGEAVLRLRGGGEAAAAELTPPSDARGTPPERPRGAGGLGVGLTVARAIIEMHGGAITVDAASGDGAEIVVRLPLRPQDSAPGPAGRRVVLVEDNADLSDTLRELLQELGHEVSVAPDGQTGVERVLALRPDVVLVDIGLPDIDGYEVARRIRQASPQGLTLVAMTGYSQADDRRRAEAAGFDTHMTKPPRLDLLQKLLTDSPRRT